MFRLKRQRLKGWAGKGLVDTRSVRIVFVVWGYLALVSAEGFFGEMTPRGRNIQNHEYLASQFFIASF